VSCYYDYPLSSWHFSLAIGTLRKIILAVPGKINKIHKLINKSVRLKQVAI